MPPRKYKTFTKAFKVEAEPFSERSSPSRVTHL